MADEPTIGNVFATQGANRRLGEDRPVRVHLREDHASIARLAEDLLPALIAKLASSGLGEIEVREGGWKARLRKPDGAPEPKRPVSWAGAQGHAGHGHISGHGPAEGARRPCDEEEEPAPDPKRAVATSPAVGIYHPRRDLTVGMRVRAGDRIGTVDVLGVREEVTAPVDGVVGASLVEAGDAVEYGQELVRIELPSRMPQVPPGAVASDGSHPSLPGQGTFIPGRES